ncbi:MAG: hypothetical protein ABSC15_03000 [Terriglobales bacterium]
MHSVPGFAWSPSGYATVVNQLVLCEDPGDFTTQLGLSSQFGPGVTPAYGLAEIYDACFVEENVGPIVVVNVWDPYSMSTLVTQAALTINAQSEIPITGEVILASLNVKGVSNTQYVQGVDYTFAYNDETLQTGIITVLPTSAMLAEGSVTVKFNTPALADVTWEDIVGAVETNGQYTGLELLDQVFDTFSIDPMSVLTPGFSHLPQVAAAKLARCLNIQNGRKQAISYDDIDHNAVTQYSQIEAWKSSNNYESSSQIVSWPNGTLGNVKFYHGSTIEAVIDAVTDAQFGNIPYAVPSNKEAFITGTILKAGVPIRVSQTQADYIEELGVVTFLNSQGWKTLGDYTAGYDSGTEASNDPAQFWISLKRSFVWLGNTLSNFLAGEIDLPGNNRSLSTIENSLQQYLNTFIQVGAAWTARCQFNADENPAANILNGVYTFHILISWPTAIRTLNLLMEYDVAGLTASIASVNLSSSS